MQIIVIAITTLIMSTTNKILYKMALVPMKNYPFFLAQILTFGYVIVYSSILLYRYKNGLVTREMLKMPKKPFIAIGFLEALGLAIGMAAAINLPGASIPILNQVYLVWQLIFSATILKKKYSLGQIVGCLLVLIGVVIAITSEFKVHSLEQSGLFWPMIMVCSSAFSAGASIIKESIFLDSKKHLQGKSLDIFVVNTCGSTAQAFFVFLLLPFLSHLKGIRVHELPRYFKEGALCFFNCNAADQGFYGAPIVPLILLKESSAVVSSLCTTLSLPVSIWAFTFNLPLLGTPTTLPQGLYVGTIILILGLIIYNFLGKNNEVKQ
ncbi:hypothetical protein M758_11G085700 [Ceratodon purpureus]|nr:hypothetical protein M758_11G085700 [Ceratodon purpureus]